MKKIFTFSAITILMTLLFTGCIKENIGYNENYWLTKEKGEVVYSDNCQYYVIQTAHGYAILKATGSYKPYERAVVYGNFSNYGLRDFYNRSTGRIFTAEVKEYWLSYYEAQQAIYYYCPSGRNQFNKAGSDFRRLN